MNNCLIIKAILIRNAAKQNGFVAFSRFKTIRRQQNGRGIRNDLLQDYLQCGRRAFQLTSKQSRKQSRETLREPGNEQAGQEMSLVGHEAHF